MFSRFFDRPLRIFLKNETTISLLKMTNIEVWVSYTWVNILTIGIAIIIPLEEYLSSF